MRRNRVRRLIREAVRLQSDEIQVAVGEAGVGVDIVFQFRPDAALSIQRITLQHIMPEVRKILSSIARAVRQKHS